MQRYFINQECLIDNRIHIDEFNHKHLKKVMRYRNGDQVICILPDHSTYVYEIEDIDEGILIQKEKLDVNHELDVNVTLIYGLPKSDKFEFVMQKATELGVSRIVPFLSKRSIIKTDEKTFSKKYERFNKILKEAAEQSYREYIPEITPLAKLKDLSKYLSDINLVAYEESSRDNEATALKKAITSNYSTITILVGPEGGLDQQEVDALVDMGFTPCSLGKRILRTETAPLYMLSVIGYSRELM